MTVRPLPLLAGLLVAATALAGCSLEDLRGGEGSGSSAASTPQTPPAGTTGLERFYAQQLSWSDCSGAQCAQLTVPVDYEDPEAGTIRIAVLKVPAKRQSRRIGALVVNPGGPGGSGVDYARAADFIVGSGVRERYDVVGFDPRGVGRSAPIDCVTDDQLDDFLGADPTPDDPSEERAFARGAAAFATSCARTAGSLLAHVSTEDAARDMDVLRAALGEDQLTYLGKSYGTYLGATYADLFPTRVGRFVLDGVVAPDLTSEEINLGQAEGFELATRTWADYCVQEGACPLGDSVETVMENLRGFLADVDASPLTRTGDTAVSQLTEGWASLGIAAAMYDEGSWGTLVDAMRDALAGDGTALMQLADQYADRNPGGGYAGNIMEVIYAVNCLDKPESSSVSAHEQQAQEAQQEAPTWGAYLMWSSLVCGYWPVPAVSTPHTVAATGAEPIVVIGTTRDPATPYDWSVRLHDQLDKASLITYDGDGHTAYTRSNACVDDAVDAWYLDGTLPEDGLRC
ncbi:alpha/beta fold hydrolase [Phycicoccus endophyticus]|uniref:Alpha/beta fold hydrolase n=1 Tax=Phycicoccus endophyticus TaxID=1690220 RepID=A0A7G9QZS0_9MICO|nr:alpha/beta hydrolase [Phycicoccus endophyticus]NHI20040.1 alpha/beta hydrolase [Phycicoccus endophyticus]QNN48845.1 alpha/beta fold hydrolase [Phycicoccus endophyticus]GGL42354.1 proteinase [Phycicoccus endophyticus]